MVYFRVFLLSLIIIQDISHPFASATESMNNSSSDNFSSVVFVFDNTQSMSDDLIEAQQAATTILNAIIKNPAKLIYNYVLVTFKDPEIVPVVDTTDHAVFKKKLDEIEVAGGGDCQEMSLGAIKLGLERSRPKSFIYVFTDATAKDYNLHNEVLTLIQEKLSQVVFVMTGDCGEPQSVGYKVYKQIAFTSSGEVYRVKKEEVKKVLDLLKSSVVEKAQKVNLLTYTDKDESSRQRRNENITLPIDKSLSDCTVSASGDKIKLAVVNPHGVSLPVDNLNLSMVVNLENVKVVKIKNPEPGLWTFLIDSDSQYSVRTSGISDFDFQYGFSAQPTTNKENISLRPIKGTLTILQIWLSEASLKNFTNIDLVGNKEELFNSLPIEPVKGEEALYRTKSFMPPDDFFYIRVYGVSKDGHPFRRISHSAITSVKPDIAKVEITTPVVEAQALKPSKIDCKVKSLLPFDVQWTKNGKNVGALKHYLQSADVVLDIPNVLTADEGVYLCKVNNSVGAAQKEIKLIVKAAKPIIENGPANVLAVLGQWLKLECNVTAHPKATITWHFENKELPGNQITSNGSLILQNVAKNNLGNYKCTAKNPGGSAEKTTSLTVIVPPTIAGKDKETIQVIEGSNTTLECNANGLPPPVISWTKIGSDGISNLNNSKVYSVDTASLTIKNITTEFKGQYICNAENSGGVAEKLYNVTVLAKPWILNKFKYAVNLTVGDDYMLPCQAKGEPEPSVLWYKDNRKVSEDHNLILRNLTLGEGGLYKCTAKNAAGDDSGNLTINVTDDSPPNSMTRIQILETTNGTLKCPVPDMEPISSIKWLKDGLDLNVTYGGKGHRYFYEGRILQITEVEGSDNSVFTCIVQTATSKREYNITVDVGTPPYFIHHKVDTDFDIIEGKSVSFVCVAGGNPQPKIKWRRIVKGTNIPITPDAPGISMGKKNRELIIKSAKSNHTGVYVCIVSNSFDVLERSFTLDVNGLPEIEGAAVENVELTLGDSYNLVCKIKGIPVPEYSWTFTDKRGNKKHSMNGTSIDRINSPFYYDVLRLENVTASNSGDYSCTAKNRVGSTTKNFIIAVLDKPTIEESNKIEKVIIESSEKLHLSCKITSSPVLKVEWLRNGISVKRQINEKESKNHPYFIDLLPINGNYTCRGSNKAGIIEKNFNVIVET